MAHESIYHLFASILFNRTVLLVMVSTVEAVKVNGCAVEVISTGTIRHKWPANLSVETSVEVNNFQLNAC